MTPDKVADEAEKLLAGGFRALKLRLGYPTLQDDLAALRAVKKRVGSEVAVMVDYNQALSLTQALERGRALDQEGIYWLEEPIRHDDYAGNGTLVRELATPIQIGENFSESAAMAVALAAQAADYVMPDLERIGGVTGWLRDVVASLSRSERASARRHAHLPFSRICGLGGQDRGGAAADRRRLCRCAAASRDRGHLESQRGGEVSA
jgi:mandelate racemase